LTHRLLTPETWKQDVLGALLFLVGLMAGLLWDVSPWLVLAFMLFAFVVFVVRFRHHRGKLVRLLLPVCRPGKGA
jgi:hypothetical protein